MSLVLRVAGGSGVECSTALAERFKHLGAPGDLVPGRSLDCPSLEKRDVERVVDFGRRTLDDSAGGIDLDKVERPLRSVTLTECGLPDWVDAWFRAVDTPGLFALFKAATTLGFDLLNEVCAIVVAQRIRSLDTTAFQSTFALSREFTREEESRVRELYDLGDDE